MNKLRRLLLVGLIPVIFGGPAALIEAAYADMANP